MTYLVPDQDKIYISTNDKTKPIKLIYADHAECVWDKDSNTNNISIKLPILDDTSLFNDLFEEYFDVGKNNRDIKPDASYFKSLL